MSELATALHVLVTPVELEARPQPVTRLTWIHFGAFLFTLILLCLLALIGLDRWTQYLGV